MSRLRNVETVTRSPGGASLLKELVADRFSERVLVLRRERWMLSITHIMWCQKVLRQPAYQPPGAVLSICNAFTVTHSTPCVPGACDDGFIECTCVFDSFDRMLSITAVGRYR